MPAHNSAEDLAIFSGIKPAELCQLKVKLSLTNKRTLADYLLQAITLTCFQKSQDIVTIKEIKLIANIKEVIFLPVARNVFVFL